MNKTINQTNFQLPNQTNFYKGKVRDVYTIGDDKLVMVTSDRISAFDHVLPKGIPFKGQVLNQIAAKFLTATEDIVPNWMEGNPDPSVTIGKRCEPFKVEMVIRGYLTGHAWREYKKGKRILCGVSLPDGMIENQKFDNPIITPTTKGKIDKPISKQEIINEGYLNEIECEFIFKKALELFNYGQKLATKAGFILVDTKYEFGRDNEGNIILMDELHTCDSSRFWIKSTYENRFLEKIEPEKLDKDCVRDWVKSVCDPYNDVIPEIPKEIINKAYNTYKFFYDTIIKPSNI